MCKKDPYTCDDGWRVITTTKPFITWGGGLRWPPRGWNLPELGGRGVATGGISVFIPPKSAQVNFLCGKNDVRTAIQHFYTPQKLLYPQNKFLATPLLGGSRQWAKGVQPLQPPDNSSTALKRHSHTRICKRPVWATSAKVIQCWYDGLRQLLYLL